MLTLPPTVRVFLAPGATDMRKQFDGLAQVARDVIRRDPLSGHLFVFCNRRRDRLKILVWDRTGFWLLAKRLEKGTFAWPNARPSSSGGIEMASEELTALLAGFDVSRVPRRRWWRRDVVREESSEMAHAGS